MAALTLIEIEGLTRSFGDIRALKSVSFSLRPGQVLGFLGPNGAGKTTTMNILTGNLAPSGGSVRICGIDPVENPTAAKAHIGYLPETPPIYREFTVDEYLRFCARLHRIPRRETGQAIAKAKRRCGLTAVGHRLIGNLSKGYRQRVGIAQAIVHEPDVVILDEPTVGLDPIQIREIRELIGELGTLHGVILSTHILSEVQSVCSHVQIINGGQLLLSAPIDDLETHLTGRSLLFAWRRPPTAEQIRTLCPSTDVHELGEGQYRIRYTDNDPTDILVRASVEADWGLCRIGPEHLSLEQVFLQLTDRETSA